MRSKADLEFSQSQLYISIGPWIVWNMLFVNNIEVSRRVVCEQLSHMNVNPIFFFSSATATRDGLGYTYYSGPKRCIILGLGGHRNETPGIKETIDQDWMAAVLVPPRLVVTCAVSLLKETTTTRKACQMTHATDEERERPLGVSRVAVARCARYATCSNYKSL
jgi:hypothetical protein